MRTITLPAVNMTVPLRAYLRAVKDAKANPGRTYRHGLTTWWPTTGAEIMRQFLRGVNDRINQGISYTERR